MKIITPKSTIIYKFATKSYEILCTVVSLVCVVCAVDITTADFPLRAGKIRISFSFPDDSPVLLVAILFRWSGLWTPHWRPLTWQCQPSMVPPPLSPSVPPAWMFLDVSLRMRMRDHGGHFHQEGGDACRQLRWGAPPTSRSLLRSAPSWHLVA